GGRRVDDQGAYVTDVSEVGVQLQGVDELPCSLARVGVAGRQVEGKNGASVLQAQLLLDLVPRAGLQAGVGDAGDLRMLVQELGHLLGVLVVLLDTQVQGVETLDSQPSVERGEGGAGVAQQTRTSLQAEGWLAEVRVLQAVVRRV